MGTIQSDVQGKEPQKQIAAEQTNADNSDSKREPTARELAMDAISANRNKAFEEESGISLTPGDDAEAKEAAAAQADADALAARETLAQDAELELQGDAPNKATQAVDDILKRKLTVKINGVESVASVEEMQRYFQKGESADRKLAVAAQREKELLEREAAFQAEVARSKEVAATAVVHDPAEAKAFTAAMFEGDEDKATEAFNKAVSKAVESEMAGRPQYATQVNIEELTSTIEQRFAVNSALKQSQADYPELYADADMEELAAAKIRRKQQAEGMSFSDALESTGSEMASKFGWAKAAGHQKKADSTARDTKLARKEGLDTVAGIGVKTSTQEAAPLTHSQIIAEMAKSRGQGV